MGKGALEMLWRGDLYLSKEFNERHAHECADSLGLWCVILKRAEKDQKHTCPTHTYKIARTNTAHGHSPALGTYMPGGRHTRWSCVGKAHTHTHTHAHTHHTKFDTKYETKTQLL